VIFGLCGPRQHQEAFGYTKPALGFEDRVGFGLEHDFEIPTAENADTVPTLLARRDQFERWMLKSALRRLPKPVSWEALGDVYGAKRDAMRRRAKELNFDLPKSNEL
jgi:hypothetical protein